MRTIYTSGIFGATLMVTLALVACSGEPINSAATEQVAGYLLSGFFGAMLIWGPLLLVAYELTRLVLSSMQMLFFPYRKRAVFQTYILTKRIPSAFMPVIGVVVPVFSVLVVAFLIGGTPFGGIHARFQEIATAHYARLTGLFSYGWAGPQKFFAIPFLLVILLYFAGIFSEVRSDTFQKWMKSNDKLGTLNNEGGQDDNRFLGIAMDPAQRTVVRKAAIAQISSQAVLAEIYVTTGIDSSLRRHVEKLWPGVTEYGIVQDEHKTTESDAVLKKIRKLEDPKEIKKLYEEYDDINFREQVIGLINDPELLSELLLASQEVRLYSAGLEKITDKDTIAQLYSSTVNIACKRQILSCLEDQKMISELVKNEEDFDVLIHAVELLSSFELLKILFQETIYTKVQTEIINKIDSQSNLQTLFTLTKNKEIKAAILRKIENDSVILEMLRESNSEALYTLLFKTMQNDNLATKAVLNTEDKKLSRDALTYIQKKKNFLEIIYNSKDTEIVKKAIDKINSKRTINELIESQANTTIVEHLKERLKTLEETEKRSAETTGKEVVYSLSRPRPDYSVNTCMNDLEFINSEVMTVPYKDLNKEHITVLWEWLSSLNPPNTFGYDNEKFAALIDSYRKGKLTIQETDNEYLLYDATGNQEDQSHEPSSGSNPYGSADFAVLCCPNRQCNGIISTKDPNLLLYLQQLSLGGMIAGGNIKCSACMNSYSLSEWHQETVNRFGRDYLENAEAIYKTV